MRGGALQGPSFASSTARAGSKPQGDGIGLASGHSTPEGGRQDPPPHCPPLPMRHKVADLLPPPHPPELVGVGRGGKGGRGGGEGHAPLCVCACASVEAAAAGAPHTSRGDPYLHTASKWDIMRMGMIPLWSSSAAPFRGWTCHKGVGTPPAGGPPSFSLHCPRALWWIAHRLGWPGKLWTLT